MGPTLRLILLIAVDQFRYDYLTRFRADYTGGIRRLLTEGAVFTNANPKARSNKDDVKGKS